MASSSETECLLAAGLGTQIILPDDPKYAASIESYFDNASKLHPACFFQPRTASELATGVKALMAANQPFAVRSGGCTARAGSNNINGGVTIDLGLLKSVEYNSETETAHIGSGATWYVRSFYQDACLGYNPIILVAACLVNDSRDD